MRNTSLIIVVTTASFCVGFVTKTLISKRSNAEPTVGKVTGIGGIFFKCKDPKAMREWYKTHLDMNTTNYGATFEWREDSGSTKKGSTTWNPFAETTKYFDPSTKDFMINYRVTNLEALVEEFKRDGITIVDKIQTYDYGKFVHIMDPEGNKLELWQPVD